MCLLRDSRQRPAMEDCELSADIVSITIFVDAFSAPIYTAPMQCLLGAGRAAADREGPPCNRPKDSPQNWGLGLESKNKRCPLLMDGQILVT